MPDCDRAPRAVQVNPVPGCGLGGLGSWERLGAMNPSHAVSRKRAGPRIDARRAMGRRKLEERNLRSLDRQGLRSIFRPLDPGADTLPRVPRTWHMWSGWDPPSNPDESPDEPRWKAAIALLFLPAVVVLIEVMSRLAIPQLIAWLAVLGCFAALSVFVMVSIRSRRGRHVPRAAGRVDEDPQSSTSTSA